MESRKIVVTVKFALEQVDNDSTISRRENLSHDEMQAIFREALQHVDFGEAISELHNTSYALPVDTYMHVKVID